MYCDSCSILLAGLLSACYPLGLDPCPAPWSSAWSGSIIQHTSAGLLTWFDSHPATCGHVFSLLTVRSSLHHSLPPVCRRLEFDPHRSSLSSFCRRLVVRLFADGLGLILTRLVSSSSVSAKFAHGRCR